MRGDELGKWRMESGAWCMLHAHIINCIMYIINNYWELFFWLLVRIIAIVIMLNY